MADLPELVPRVLPLLEWAEIRDLVAFKGDLMPRSGLPGSAPMQPLFVVCSVPFEDILYAWPRRFTTAISQQHPVRCERARGPRR